jgi:ABC-type Fe3+-hydroxamate transport system substrate-binding protein
MRTIRLETTPRRIVSGAISNRVSAFLGLEEEVVGINEILHPSEGMVSIENTSRWNKSSILKVRALKPDLIIGNKGGKYERILLEALRVLFCMDE